MIVVTGAAGFIGSALVWELNQRGETDILAVDHLGTDRRWENLRPLKFSDYIEKDEFIEKIYSGSLDKSVQAIIHLGACSDTTEKDASYLIKNNYNYSKKLALWAVENKTRFVYASSAATYGDGSEGYSDNEEIIENLRPLNMYGYSKQLFDLWAFRKGILNNIAGLKYFNVFGPNEYHKGDMRSVVLKAFEQIMEDGYVRLFKSYKKGIAHGEQMRDFLYVKDAVEMTLFFVNNPEVNGIFNIGSGQARTWKDLVGAIFAALSKDGNIKFIEMPEHLRERYQYYTQAEIEKIKSSGHHGAVWSLEDAVKDYVNNYLLERKYLDH